MTFALPTEPYATGLQPAQMRISADRLLDCIAITLITDDQEFKLAIGPEAATEAVVRLIAALSQLTEHDEIDG